MGFGKDFLWGAATSSYQIEGANRVDGRGRCIWDEFSSQPGIIKNGDTAETACDHYHRYPEDVDLMTQIGLDAYRFSISWPRIIPDGDGAPNEKGLDFYSRLVDTLLEAGLVPFVTLNHWDFPQALQQKGGWCVRESIGAFERYTDFVTRRLGDRVKFWTTHNEPWCITFLGYHQGYFAPGISDLKQALQATHNLFVAHGKAAAVIRAHVNDARVGIAPNYKPIYPATDHPDDIAAARRYDGHFNRWFADPFWGRGYPQDLWEYYGNQVPDIAAGDMETIAAPLDFLGVNYYHTSTVRHAPDANVPQITEVLDYNAPVGLYELLTRLHHDYSPPALYITENGYFHKDITAEQAVRDPERIAFLHAHFQQAARAIEAGVPLKGFFVWSLMDNFEWREGYSIRMGLISVDYATQTRTLKDSAKWYRTWIAANH